MKRLILSVMVLALFVCLVQPSVATDNQGEETPKEVLLDDGDLLVLELMTTESAPIGGVEVTEWASSNGESSTQSSQIFQLALITGDALDLKVTCTHSGCTGSTCTTGGCKPTKLNNCSPATCIGEDGCTCQTPKCSKSVSTTSTN